MSNSIGLDGLIENAGITDKVVTPNNSLRSIADGMKLLSSIAAEAKEIKPFDFDGHHDVIRRIMAARAIYPQAFEMLFNSSPRTEDQDKAELSAAIAELFKSGEIPKKNIVTGNEIVSVDGFEYDASLEEAITKALEHPPTQDFLKDHALGYTDYHDPNSAGYKLVISVDSVRTLLSSAVFFDHRLSLAKNYLNERLDDYTNLDTEKNQSVTRYDTLIGMLELVSHYIPLNDAEHREEFEKDVRIAKNSPDTKLEDYLDLYKKGMALAIALNKAVRDRNLAMFEAIMSGEASRYKSPDTNSDKKAS